MKLISVIILCSATYTLHAQNGKSGLVVGSSGGGKTPSNTTLTWTIGQPIIKTFSNGEVNLSSGNQQTDIKLLITSTEEKNSTSLQILAYPNPTQDQLTITFNEALKSTSNYDLFSANGTCVSSNIILTNNQTIDVSSLLTGMYILNVHINNVVKSFKIIKQ